MLASKFHTYKYKWKNLSVIVDCTKCGNNIVLQNFEGNPECSDCGNVNKLSWEHIIREIDIPGMQKGGSDHKVMMGSINGKVQMDDVDNINCYHCKQPVTLPAQEELTNYSCNHCNQQLLFKEYPGFDELVFYRSAAGNIEKEKINLIAVRCVSCGAPLEVDPTKNNFNCKFCSTDNILPVSLRYKVILDDVFVGLRNSKYLKLAAFESNGTIVKQTLRENGKASFADDELDKILLTQKNDLEVYKQITQEFKYLPPDKVLQELFETSTNQTLIELVGTRLQKTKEGIDQRVLIVSGGAVKKNITKESNTVTAPRKTTKSKLSSPFMIIIMIVFVLTMIAMINLILN